MVALQNEVVIQSQPFAIAAPLFGTKPNSGVRQGLFIQNKRHCNHGYCNPLPTERQTRTSSGKEQ